MATKRLFARNTSTRRIILGGKKGVPMTTFGGSDDKDVDKAPDIGRELDAERSARFRTGGMGELAQRLGLQLA